MIGIDLSVMMIVCMHVVGVVGVVYVVDAMYTVIIIIIN